MSNYCSICPRQCGVDRSKSTGFCKSGNELKIARAALHFWEEPCISSKNGSGTIFFSGCSLKCVYCQNYKISTGNFGKTVSDERFIEIVEELKKSGANNINLVNPTHFAYRLAEIFKRYSPQIPIVYNTGGYETPQTLELLNGLVDIYLTDIKYFDSEVAEKYSSAANYPETAFAAAEIMRKQIPEDTFDKNGIMLKGLIIRNLILPGNVSQTIKILNRLDATFPKETIISVMSQYTPCSKAENLPPLNRKISRREYNIVKNHLRKTSFENIYFQSYDSSGKEYIPEFDLSGV